MSFSWDAFIVPASDEEAFGRVKKWDRSAVLLPGGFARVYKNSGTDWAEPGAGTKLSREFGEAWFLFAHTTSTVFAYDHSRAGKILRSLAYSGDEGWIVAEGVPEYWWEGVLFEERQIALGETMVLDEPDEKRWPRELEALRDKKIVVGHMLPAPDPTLVLLIAQRLGTQLI